MNPGTNLHSMSYFVALVLLAMSIPLSKYAMSVSEFALFGLWIWSGFSFQIAFRFFKFSGPIRGFFHFIHYLYNLTVDNLAEKLGLFFRNPAAVVLACCTLKILIMP
jgi:hypothetical protein